MFRKDDHDLHSCLIFGQSDTIRTVIFQRFKDKEKQEEILRLNK